MITGNVFGDDGDRIIFTFPMRTDKNGNVLQEDWDFLQWLSNNKILIKRKSEKALRKIYNDEMESSNQ